MHDAVEILQVGKAIRLDAAKQCKDDNIVVIRRTADPVRAHHVALERAQQERSLGGTGSSVAGGVRSASGMTRYQHLDIVGEVLDMTAQRQAAAFAYAAAKIRR